MRRGVFLVLKEGEKLTNFVSHFICQNDILSVTARREEDCSPVIASPAGAKQSHKKRLGLPRRYTPRNDISSFSFYES